MKLDSRRAVRSLFVLTILVFAAQLVVTDGRREPYPALFQPSFGDGSVTAEGTTIRPQPTVTAVFDDGRTAEFDHLDVMAQARSSPWRVFRSAFGPGSPRTYRADTVAWLEHRLYELSGRHPTRAVVEWHDVSYDLVAGRVAGADLTDRVVIAFGGEDD